MSLSPRSRHTGRQLRLVIFDVDGTLIDSQDHIVLSMRSAFESEGLPCPDRSSIRGIVGLSLPLAMAALAPDLAMDRHARMVDAYKVAFAAARSSGTARSPLYPGALQLLSALSQDDHTLLGIATGKSRRGLRHVFDLHGFQGVFDTVQVSDDHPSKPHPSMIHACLADTGVDPGNAIMVGDTTFDIEMGRAGGIGAIGVTWGYHSSDALTDAGAHTLIDSFDALPDAMCRMGVAA